MTQRLLAMTIILFPALALACSGPPYDPGKPPPVKPLWERALDMLHDMSRDGRGQLVILLLCMAGFFWASRSKKRFKPILLVILGYPVTIIATLALFVILNAGNAGETLAWGILLIFFAILLWLWRKKMVWWKAVAPTVLFILYAFYSTQLC